MNNINKKERLERKGSISLSFKFDLQLFADKETLSGDPYLPDHKAQNDFIDDDTIPEVSTSRTRRTNPYTISHIDKKYKTWCTYLMHVRYESLDDWFSLHGVYYDNNVKVWPDRPNFYAPKQTGVFPDSAEQDRIKHYFDGAIYATSINRFIKSLKYSEPNGEVKMPQNWINDAGVGKIIKNINFSRCFSANEIFAYGAGLYDFNFTNNTFSKDYPISMQKGFFNATSLCYMKFKTNGTLHFQPTGINEIFSGCAILESVDFSETNLSNISEMIECFKGCTELKEVKGTISIDNFDHDKALRYIYNSGNRGAFADCKKIEKPLNFTVKLGSNFYLNFVNYTGLARQKEEMKRFLSSYLKLDKNLINLVIV